MIKTSFHKLREQISQFEKLPNSPIISIESSICLADSTYVLKEGHEGREQVWALFQRIIELEIQKATEWGNGTLTRKLTSDTEYVSRIKNKVSDAFDNSGVFHMQHDLETYLGDTNLGHSKFTREGGVVFFELKYFNPDLDSVAIKGRVETELGLEKKVTGAVRKKKYQRVGNGLFFKIPFEKETEDLLLGLRFGSPSPEEVGESFRKKGVYESSKISPSSDEKYNIKLGFHNLSSTWQNKIQMIYGTFLGIPVAEEISLFTRSRRVDYENILEQERADLNRQIKTLENNYTMNDEAIREIESLRTQLRDLENPSEELYSQFKQDGRSALKDHRKNLRRADNIYGLDNKVALPNNRVMSYLYLTNPVLEWTISLGRTGRNYSQVKAYLESVFPK